ncbi:MAG: hypothetical protein N2C14_21605, partial [Planctomycetales bacterium]
MWFRLVGRLAAVLLLALPAAAQETTKISHGPMLGRLTESSVRVWARTNRSGEFRVRYGTAPDQLNQVSKPVVTELADDNTGVAELKGLKPGVKYHYLVSVGNSTKGPGGTFRTFPDSKTLRDPKLNPRGLFNFSFEFACGNNQSPENGLGPSLPTYDTLLAQVKDNVHFAILNGDWLYEEARDYSPDQWRKQVGVDAAGTPRVGKIAPTIVGVWEN